MVVPWSDGKAVLPVLRFVVNGVRTHINSWDFLKQRIFVPLKPLIVGLDNEYKELAVDFLRRLEAGGPAVVQRCVEAVGNIEPPKIITTVEPGLDSVCQSRQGFTFHYYTRHISISFL